MNDDNEGQDLDQILEANLENQKKAKELDINVKEYERYLEGKKMAPNDFVGTGIERNWINEMDQIFSKFTSQKIGTYLKALTSRSKTNDATHQGVIDGFLDHYLTVLEKGDIKEGVVKYKIPSKDRNVKLETGVEYRITDITKYIFTFYVASGKAYNKEGEPYDPTMMERITNLAKEGRLDNNVAKECSWLMNAGRNMIKDKIIPYNPTEEVIKEYNERQAATK